MVAGSLRGGADASDNPSRRPYLFMVDEEQRLRAFRPWGRGGALDQRSLQTSGTLLFHLESMSGMWDRDDDVVKGTRMPLF